MLAICFSSTDHKGLPVVLPRETDSVLVGSAILAACAAGDFKTMKVGIYMCMYYNESTATVLVSIPRAVSCSYISISFSKCFPSQLHVSFNRIL